MSRKYLFTNGDSWTWGQGLQEDQPDHKPRGQWPDVVGEELNLDVINISECGSSNERICRTTIEWVCGNLDKIKDTLFIIGWTVSDRWEWWDNFENDWTKCYAHHGGDTLTYRMDKKWWTEFYTRFFDIRNGTYKSILQIVMLQSFLKQYNCKYLFFQGFGTHLFNKKNIQGDIEVPADGYMTKVGSEHTPHDLKVFKSLLNQFDFNNIITKDEYDSMDNFLRYKYGEDSYNEAMEKVHGHPNRESHRVWGLEICKLVQD